MDRATPACFVFNSRDLYYRGYNNNNNNNNATQARREGGRGKVFPGPATFGGRHGALYHVLFACCI